MFSTKDIKEVYRAEIRHPVYVLQDEGKQRSTLPKPEAILKPATDIRTTVTPVITCSYPPSAMVVVLVHAQTR